MLVYEKVVEEQRHLFGTMGNIPSDDDVQLTYKNEEGGALSPAPTLDDTYLDDGHGGIIRKSDDKEIRVFIGETRIIPAISDDAPAGQDPIVGTAKVGTAKIG